MTMTTKKYDTRQIMIDAWAYRRADKTLDMSTALRKAWANAKGSSTKEQTVDALVRKLGHFGNRWQANGKDRLYFCEKYVLTEAFGYTPIWSKKRCGIIDGYATKDGETLSAREVEKMSRELYKCYIDLNNLEFVSPAGRDAKIIETVKAYMSV